MKRTLRLAVFETNSSSSHSLSWGYGEYSTPYPISVPEEPDEDSYDSWEAWYDAHLEFEDALRDAIPIANPDWDEETTWESPTRSGIEYPITTGTLTPGVFNKLSALLYLVDQYAGALDRRSWEGRINSMFDGVDVCRFLGEVGDWNGMYLDINDAAEILSQLGDDEALARFLFDDETTIKARFAG